jgi:KipI family sensor histidine kinase inhibitor
MHILPFGETAVLVELDSLDHVLGLCDSLTRTPIPGVLDAVPAARTVLVSFDPAVVGRVDVVREVMSRPVQMQSLPDAGQVEIAVVYDGPDLAEVAAESGMSVAELVTRHLRCSYVVAFIGFAPGFYYLSGGDPLLRVGRLPSPRTRVPVGSIGIAGQFSGIYPKTGPGGWKLIASTRDELWNPQAAPQTPMALLAPGTRVRFVEEHA